MKYGFGADLGGTTVKLALFSQDGELLEKWEIPTDTSNGGDAILHDIAVAVGGCQARHDIVNSDVLGIGIGVPGPVRKGGIVSAVNLGWKDRHVKEDLENFTGLSVAVENDANAATLGEMWKGSGMGYRNIVMVTLGTGVGSGIVLDGVALTGAHSAAGEVGHLPLDPTETRKCNCGNHGCFEQFASATGLTRIAADYLAAHSAPTILRDSPNPDSKAIWDAAKVGDSAAVAITDEYCRRLGQGLAIITAVVDPELVLLGGGVSKAGQILVDRTTPYYAEYAFNPCKATEIRLASLGNDAGVYGCMYSIL